MIFLKNAYFQQASAFEEPEAHTFPPYISILVNDLIASEDNQSFITTHSPYVMSALLSGIYTKNSVISRQRYSLNLYLNLIL